MFMLMFMFMCMCMCMCTVWQALLARGVLVKLASSVKGPLKAVHHAEEVEALPSMLSFRPKYSELGESVRLTIDLPSAAGFALLVNAEAEALQADYQRLCHLQTSMFVVGDDGNL